MTDDGVIGGDWLRDLGDIHCKLARLAQDFSGAGDMAAELAELEQRLARLIRHLKDPAAAGGGPESKVILVVDDNDELREFVTQALELAGYQVLDSADGESTLEMLRQTEAIDLVLCDVILPGIRGGELVRQIRGIFPDVEVIFMSGYVSEDIVNQDVAQIVASGGAFLQKPFLTRKLLATVYESLGV